MIIHRYICTAACSACLMVLCLISALGDEPEWECQIVEDNKQAVVIVETSSNQGSGFVVSDEGYVLTARHITDDPMNDKFVGEIYGSPESKLELKYIYDDPRSDLLVLKFRKKIRYIQSIGSIARPRVGEEIVAVGYTPGAGLLNVSGVISGDDGDKGTWTTTAPVNGGMSGGPVFNRSGQVVASVVGANPVMNSVYLIRPITFANVLLTTIGSPLASGFSRSREAKDEWSMYLYSKGLGITAPGQLISGKPNRVISSNNEMSLIDPKPLIVPDNMLYAHQEKLVLRSHSFIPNKNNVDLWEYCESDRLYPPIGSKYLLLKLEGKPLTARTVQGIEGKEAVIGERFIQSIRDLRSPSTSLSLELKSGWAEQSIPGVDIYAQDDYLVIGPLEGKLPSPPQDFLRIYIYGGELPYSTPTGAIERSRFRTQCQLYSAWLTFRPSIVTPASEIRLYTEGEIPGLVSEPIWRCIVSDRLYPPQGAAFLRLRLEDAVSYVRLGPKEENGNIPYQEGSISEIARIGEMTDSRCFYVLAYQKMTSVLIDSYTKNDSLIVGPFSGPQITNQIEYLRIEINPSTETKLTGVDNVRGSIYFKGSPEVRGEWFCARP